MQHVYILYTKAIIDEDMKTVRVLFRSKCGEICQDISRTFPNEETAVLWRNHVDGYGVGYGNTPDANGFYHAIEVQPARRDSNHERFIGMVVCALWGLR